ARRPESRQGARPRGAGFRVGGHCSSERTLTSRRTRVSRWIAARIAAKFSSVGLPSSESMRCRLFAGLPTSIDSASKPMVALTSRRSADLARRVSPSRQEFTACARSTSQPLAAQAGLQMLAAGGTAVDAALAAAITLTLVEPVSNGIGSDAYAIVWDGRQLHGLNASGRSPAGWTPEFFGGQKAMPARG